MNMYKIKGASQATDEYIDVSFRKAQLWPGQHGGMFLSVLLIGDDTSGPGLALTATAPGAESPTGKAHGHASDNFRISLRGSFLMGKEEYGPGAFRFQDGWRTYPSDNNACGPDGGWELTMMADRRGTRRREIQGWVAGSAEAEAEFALQRYFAETFEFDGDLVDADGTVSPGPSALLTTAGPTSNSGKLNGSFADADSWTSVSDSTRALVSVLGDAVQGPVIALAETSPHQVAASASYFDTELMRFVIAGSCGIDGRIYEAGDIRMQLPSKACGPVSAGPDGLQELLVFGDRRFIGAADDTAMWPANVSTIVGDLMETLWARELSHDH
jgi:hypothetical protein